jgi:hypothetical protein
LPLGLLMACCSIKLIILLLSTGKSISFKTWATVAVIGILLIVLALCSPGTRFCLLKNLNVCSSLYSVRICWSSPL